MRKLKRTEKVISIVVFVILIATIIGLVLMISISPGWSIPATWTIFWERVVGLLEWAF